MHYQEARPASCPAKVFAPWLRFTVEHLNRGVVVESGYCSRISQEHPALDGHFPGNPIVPGVVLLTEMLRAVETEFGRAIQVQEFRTVKFIAPLRPGQPFTICIEAVDACLLKFTMTSDGTTIASGLIRHAGV